MPQEAVLDWPFCVFGADGDERLCPYFSKTLNQYALRQFHRKKSISQYFGRMHDSQKQILLNEGWEKMFLYDTNSNPFRPMQARCWNEREWDFFLNFFYKYNFAGINLYVEILPKSCLEEWIKRLGQPASKTYLEHSGELWFFKKP